MVRGKEPNLVDGSQTSSLGMRGRVVVSTAFDFMMCP